MHDGKEHVPQEPPWAKGCAITIIGVGFVPAWFVGMFYITGWVWQLLR